MKPAESRFKVMVVGALKDYGALLFKVHGHAMQQPGWPDLQVYHPRWSGHLELKVGKNPLSLAQKLIMRELNAHGMPAFTLRCAKEDGALIPFIQIENAEGSSLQSGAWPGGDMLLDQLHALSQDTWALLRAAPLAPMQPWVT